MYRILEILRTPIFHNWCLPFKIWSTSLCKLVFILELYQWSRITSLLRMMMKFQIDFSFALCICSILGTVATWNLDILWSIGVVEINLNMTSKVPIYDSSIIWMATSHIILANLIALVTIVLISSCFNLHTVVKDWSFPFFSFPNLGNEYGASTCSFFHSRIFPGALLALS